MQGRGGVRRRHHRALRPRRGGRPAGGTGGGSRWSARRRCWSGYLLAPPAVVLDVGGGPGAYAVWLAGLGYEVALVDPVELHVTQARAAGARGRGGCACPAVLPTRRADARVAARTALPPARGGRLAGARLRRHARVLRPGGVVVGLWRHPRFASAIDGLLKGVRPRPGVRAHRRERPARRVGTRARPQSALVHRPRTSTCRTTSVLTGSAPPASSSTTGVAIEGIGAWLRDVDDWLDDPERRAALLRSDRARGDRAGAARRQPAPARRRPEALTAAQLANLALEAAHAVGAARPGPPGSWAMCSSRWLSVSPSMFVQARLEHPRLRALTFGGILDRVQPRLEVVDPLLRRQQLVRHLEASHSTCRAPARMPASAARPRRDPRYPTSPRCSWAER